MQMWMWFGYDVGDFMFDGIVIKSRWSFTICWFVLFFVALLFEASKVYLAKVQRDAQRILHPHRSDERRNLLCRDTAVQQAGNMTASTSRSAEATRLTPVPLKIKMMSNLYHVVVFVTHNVVGNLLMLAVMVYNVELILAVVFGMMAGYFLFGPKLTALQLQCFGKRRDVICTPECDDTAETSTPPLLDTPHSSESDFFICQTRTCIQPSYYFPSTSRDGASVEQGATCYYGAKKCPSKVAKAKKVQATAHCHHENKEDSPGVEDVQLLRTERQGCCKKKQEPPPETCCKKEIVEEVKKCCKREEERQEPLRETSPQITCCASKITASSSSQEHIVK